MNLVHCQKQLECHQHILNENDVKLLKFKRSPETQFMEN